MDSFRRRGQMQEPQFRISKKNPTSSMSARSGIRLQIHGNASQREVLHELGFFLISEWPVIGVLSSGAEVILHGLCISQGIGSSELHVRMAVRS